MTEFRIDSGRICVAKRNTAGALTLYGRIARADHRMEYRSGSGSRFEVIPSAELFRSDSLETFQTLPVTHGHPTERVMSPSNWQTNGKGSTHPTFFKEVTNHGTFLGQLFTIFDKDLADSVEAGKVKGLSPGYSIDHLDALDGKTFAQRGRKGNHLSVVEMPRGGDGVEAVLAGLRIDNEDAVIWTVHNDDLYLGEVDEWCKTRIDSLLNGERMEVGLIERSAIDLGGVKPDRTRSDDGPTQYTTAGTQVPSMLPLVGAPSPAIVSSYKECGDSCECDDCSLKKKKGFVMDDEMMARLSDMMDAKLASYSEGLEAEEYESERESELAEVRELLDEALELLESVGDREDSADWGEDAIVFDSIASFAETASKLLADYSQYRSDAAMVGIEVAGTDEEAIKAYVVNAQDLQRDILAKVAPDVRTDALEDESLEAAYQFAMTGLRKAHTDRNDMSDIDRLQLMGGIANHQKTSAHRTIAGSWFNRGKLEAK